jgi:hypothetical protein
MAELPRYQPTGYLPADVPRLDFANLKESVAMTQGINASLDRLAGFAFKEAEEKAEREGLKFGVENRPSADQFIAALQAGKSPEELFAEPGTTFGNAARKIQAAQLRNELEVKARNEFAIISGKVKSGIFNLEDVQGNLKAITDGYSRAISSVSPEEGLKFRASVGSAGAPVYAAAAERAYQMYAEKQKVNADDLISQTPIIIGDLLRVVKDPVELAKHVNVERQRIFDIAIATNDPQFFAEKRAEFERGLMGAIVDYTTTTAFAPNAAEGLRKIQMGDFGQLDRVMTKVNKDKLMKMFADRNGEIATAFINTTKKNASINIDVMSSIKDDHYKGKISGAEVIKRAKALDIFLPDEERKSLIGGDKNIANEMVYGQFESMAENQLVGESYFDDLANNKVIGWEQANKLKKIVRNDSPEMNQANQLINFTLGINDPMTMGFGDSRKIAAETKAELINRRQLARANGEVFNPLSVANELIKTEKIQKAIENQKSAKERISNKFKEKKIEYNPDRTYTVEDLKLLGFQDIEAALIFRIQSGNKTNVR